MSSVPPPSLPPPGYGGAPEQPQYPPHPPPEPQYAQPQYADPQYAQLHQAPAYPQYASPPPELGTWQEPKFTGRNPLIDRYAWIVTALGFLLTLGLTYLSLSDLPAASTQEEKIRHWSVLASLLAGLPVPVVWVIFNRLRAQVTPPLPPVLWALMAIMSCLAAFGRYSTLGTAHASTASASCSPDIVASLEIPPPPGYTFTPTGVKASRILIPYSPGARSAIKTVRRNGHVAGFVVTTGTARAIDGNGSVLKALYAAKARGDQVTPTSFDGQSAIVGREGKGAFAFTATNCLGITAYAPDTKTAAVIASSVLAANPN